MPWASFDALFLAPFFLCFSASHAPFDNRNGLRDALLLLGELGAIVLWIQTGGAPDARKRGVEPSLSGPVRPSLSVRPFAILRRRMAKGISIGAPFRNIPRHCAIAFGKSAQDSEKDSERYALR